MRRLRVILLVVMASICRGESPLAHSPAPIGELVMICPSGRVFESVRVPIEKFETEHPGWKIRVISSPGRDYYVKTLTLFAAHSPVDVLWLGLGFGMFVERNILLPIDSYLKADSELNESHFVPPALGMYSARGRLYGIPYGLDIQAYAINEDLLKAGHLPVPDNHWSLADLLSIGQQASQVQTGTTHVYGLGMTGIPLGCEGLTILSADGQTFTLSSAESLNWLERNISLAQQGVLLRSAAMGQLNRLGEFIAGRVAIMEVYSWELEELRRSASFKWKLLPPPLNPQNTQYAWTSSSGFCISARSKNQEMAWELVKALTSADVQRKWMSLSVPTLKTVNAEYQRELSPNEAAIREILPLLKPDPRVKNWEKISSEWKYWEDKAFQRELPAAEAQAIATQRIQRILDADPRP